MINFNLDGMMDLEIHKSDMAIVLLHEIYGVNEFMESVKRRLTDEGLYVVCPDMIGREPFTYSQTSEAYDFFNEHVGFEIAEEVSPMVTELKKNYPKVFVLGFSVGATIAWRCSDNNDCDGVIGCYGSRIRDHLQVSPMCPTLLLFAEEEYFDVDEIVNCLDGKALVHGEKICAKHGFMDAYGANFDAVAAEKAWSIIADFLSNAQMR